MDTVQHALDRERVERGKLRARVVEQLRVVHHPHARVRRVQPRRHLRRPGRHDVDVAHPRCKHGQRPHREEELAPVAELVVLVADARVAVVDEASGGKDGPRHGEPRGVAAVDPRVHGVDDVRTVREALWRHDVAVDDRGAHSRNVRNGCRDGRARDAVVGSQADHARIARHDRYPHVARVRRADVCVAAPDVGARDGSTRAEQDDDNTEHD